MTSSPGRPGDAHAPDRDGVLPVLAIRNAVTLRGRSTTAAYDPLCACTSSGAPLVGLRERQHEHDGGDRQQERRGDLHDPHARAGDAHAWDVRRGGKILGAHATRLRALGRCGKPSNAHLGPGPGPAIARRAPRRLAGAGSGASRDLCARRRSVRLGVCASASSAPQPRTLRQRLRPPLSTGSPCETRMRSSGQLEQRAQHRPQVVVRARAEPALGAQAQGVGRRPGFAPAPSRTSPTTSARVLRQPVGDLRDARRLQRRDPARQRIAGAERIRHRNLAVAQRPRRAPRRPDLARAPSSPGGAAVPVHGQEHVRGPPERRPAARSDR